jgi:hypothetical protein
MSTAVPYHTEMNLELNELARMSKNQMSTIHP